MCIIFYFVCFINQAYPLLTLKNPLLPYFIDQSPRRLIISFCRYLRRLFEGGDYSRAASLKEYCHTITFITSYKFVPSFIVILFLINVSIYVLFICLDPLKLECSIIRPFLRRHFLYYTLSTLSWRDRKTDKVGIHLTENRSNQRHVIFDGR